MNYDLSVVCNPKYRSSYRFHNQLLTLKISEQLSITFK